MDAVFPVGEVARRAGVSTSTLRAWERRFGLLDPQRTEGGHRRYTMRDVERARAVVALLDQGWAVDAAARHVLGRGDDVGAGAPTALGADVPEAGGTEPAGSPSGRSAPTPTGTDVGAASRSGDPTDPVVAATEVSPPTPTMEGAHGSVAVLEAEAVASEADTDDRARPVDADGHARSAGMLDPQVLVHQATRRLIHATSPAEVTAVLCGFVERFGGEVLPAEEAGADAIPIDLAFGAAPLLPVAPATSVAAMHLGERLPGLVDDARRIVDLLRAARRN